MVLTRQALDRLTSPHPEPCISIYFPAVRKDDTAQNIIRFKNLVRRAHAELVASGMSDRQAGERLAEASGLTRDPYIWDRLGDGAALFISEGFFEFFSLPFTVEESVTVNRRFLIKPILRLVTSGGRFFVLALSRSKSRFFEATPHSIREITPRFLPQGFADTQPEHRAAERGRAFSVERRGAAGSVHGREVNTVDRADLRRHCAVIDRLVNETLRDSGAPLVLAGVAYETAAYRNVNTYPYLVEGGLEGNFDDARAAELLPRARALVEPNFRQGVDAAVSRYRDLSASDFTSSDIRAILPAVHDGRVQSLFIRENGSVWGVFEPETTGFQVHDSRRPGDEDLVDLAAASALETGAQVFLLPEARMPDRSPVAAIFRY